jgi:hypothetical protein
MGQDPDAIRKDIERTRSEMDETIGAIGHKADVPSRTKDAVNEKVDTVKQKVGLATSRAGDATPDGAQVKQGARQAVGIAQSNPLGLAIGAAAAGFIAGLAIPETRKEHETLGELSDQVTDKAKEIGQEAVERGREVAQQTAATAQEQAKQQGQELASSASPSS